MDADIVPEPSPAERDAIEALLVELEERWPRPVAALYGSRWRLAALRENAGDDLASLE